MRHGLWFAALACVAAASVAQASDYVRVQFAPAKEPALFFQFDEDTMRIATTAEGLATAEAVAAEPADFSDRQGEAHWDRFRAVALPVLPPGATSATASFEVMRMRPSKRLPKGVVWPTDVIGRFAISTPGGARDTWTYETTAFVQVPNDANKPSAANAPVLVIGNLSQPVLTVESQVKGRKAGIAVRLWAGTPRKAKEAGSGQEILIPSDTATSVQSLQRNRKPARVHLDVIAPPGKTIKSEDGDLTKFGAG